MVRHTPTDRLTAVDERDTATVYYDDDRGTYHAWVEFDDADPVSTAVPLAVASARETDPVDLEPLNDCVDPDALDALFAGETAVDSSRSVQFAFAGCSVTVHGHGEIEVELLLD